MQLRRITIGVVGGMALGVMYAACYYEHSTFASRDILLFFAASVKAAMQYDTRCQVQGTD